MPRADAAVWREVGHAVSRRRGELGISSQSQLAALAGVHVNTVSRLERGTAVKRSNPTWGAIEAALSWPEGTIASMAGIRPNTATPLTADAVSRAVLTAIHRVEPEVTIRQANEIAAQTVAQLEQEGLLPGTT